MNAFLKKVMIGTWPLSGDFGNVSLDDVQHTLKSAYDSGILEYDTAPNYGHGFMESALGKIFHNDFSVLFNTKVGNFPFEGKFFDIDSMQRSVEQSLNRLQCENINILYLHNPRNEIENYEDILDWLNALKQKGLIRQTGISLAKNHDYDHNLLGQFDVIQDEANLLNLDILFNESTFEKLAIRSPLASGILGGHITNDTTFPEDDHRSGWLRGERLTSIMKRVRVLKDIAKCNNLTLATMSKLFLLQSDKVTSIIFGVRRVSHVESLINDLSHKLLSPDLIEELTELYKKDFGLDGERHLSY